MSEEAPGEGPAIKITLEMVYQQSARWDLEKLLDPQVLS